MGFDPSVVSQIGRFLVCPLLIKLSRSVRSPLEVTRVQGKTQSQKVPLLPFCPEWPRFVPFDPQKSFLACVVAFLSSVVSFLTFA